MSFVCRMAGLSLTDEELKHPQRAQLLLLLCEPSETVQYLIRMPPAHFHLEVLLGTLKTQKKIWNPLERLYCWDPLRVTANPCWGEGHLEYAV